MKLPHDGHSHFQGLISARLDGMLVASEELELSEHLAECPSCRSTSRDYRTQRGLMSSLPPRPAPRDLWARTSAALDREMARNPRASERAGSRRDRPLATRSAPGSRWLGLTAATSVLLAGAVVATQLQATVAPTSGPSTQAVQPTPFDVAPQDMSVFDFTAHGVSVYQTRVTEACPVLSIDCTSLQLPTLPVIQISGTSATNRGLAVNWHSGQLALVTSQDSGSETVSVVRLPRYASASATDAPTQRPTPVGTDSATGSQAPTSSAAAATPTDQPIPADTPSPGSTPRPTTNGSQTPKPTHTSPASSPSVTPDPSTPKPVKTHRPTPAPTEPASTTQPTGPDPTPSQSPATPLPTDSGSGPTATGDAITPQPAEVAKAIAEGVRLVGAAPAWSTAGDMLAFSATPADLSTGPDIYLWKVGQNKAVRLTQDHRSYFASWAADRIVISRAPADDNAGAVEVSTVVMDLGTGEERVVTGAKLWLPAVEPSARYAVAWVGRLHTDGLSVTPRFGGLYMVDWTAIDPFADHSGRPATTHPAGDGSAGGDPITTPSAAVPDITPAPARTPRGHRASPTAGTPTDAPPTSTPVPTAADPTDNAASPVLQAVEPQRDETADPVVDWVVRWSADGDTVGIWVADTPASNWGRLAVVRVSLQDGQFGRVPVLGPTLARRAFSLGVDRVAWVAPAQDTSNGELRIRTWDARGYGDIRIHNVNVDTGDSLPAF